VLQGGRRFKVFSCGVGMGESHYPHGARAALSAACGFVYEEGEPQWQPMVNGGLVADLEVSILSVSGRVFAGS
jgi:hypothetical protein